MNSIESLRLDFNSQMKELGNIVIKRFLMIAYMLDQEILMWLGLLSEYLTGKMQMLQSFRFSKFKFIKTRHIALYQ